MKTQSTNLRTAKVSVLLLLACGFASPTIAQAPNASKNKTAEPEKTVLVSINNQPWSKVLDWFSKESGLVLIATALPSGSVTIKTKPGTKYTIPQVVDLLNRSLALQKFILLRIDSTTFTVLPADEKIPEAYIPRIPLSCLIDKANTEIVQVIIEVEISIAEEIVERIRTRLGLFGDVKLIAGNQILITDSVQSIRNQLDELKIDSERRAIGESLTYRCKHIDASKAARYLRESLINILNDPDLTPLSSAQSLLPLFGQYDLRFRRPGDRPGLVQIAVHSRTNSVLVTGPADKVTIAKMILTLLDVEDPETDSIVLRIYPIPANSIEALIKVFQETYANSKHFRLVRVPGKDEILVLAPSSIQEEIKNKLDDKEEIVPSFSCQSVTQSCSCTKAPKRRFSLFRPLCRFRR